MGRTSKIKAEVTVKKTKNGKATGEDEIRRVMIKIDGEFGGCLRV